jgi:hypothetical protein
LVSAEPIVELKGPADNSPRGVTELDTGPKALADNSPRGDTKLDINLGDIGLKVLANNLPREVTQHDDFGCEPLLLSHEKTNTSGD